MSNTLQSVFSNVLSHKTNTRDSNLRKFPRDSSYFNEKMLQLKQTKVTVASWQNWLINPTEFMSTN